MVTAGSGHWWSLMVIGRGRWLQTPGVTDTDNGPAPDTRCWDVHCVTTHPQLRAPGRLSLESSLQQHWVSFPYPAVDTTHSPNSTSQQHQQHWTTGHWHQDLKCLNIGLVGIICEVVPSASEDLNNYLQITKYSPWNKSQYKPWRGTGEADNIICSRQIILF